MFGITSWLEIARVCSVARKSRPVARIVSLPLPCLPNLALIGSFAPARSPLVARLAIFPASFRPGSLGCSMHTIAPSALALVRHLNQADSRTRSPPSNLPRQDSGLFEPCRVNSARLRIPYAPASTRQLKCLLSSTPAGNSLLHFPVGWTQRSTTHT